MSMEAKIEDFHKKFGIDYDGPPRELPGKPASIVAMEHLRYAKEVLRNETDGDLASFRFIAMLEELVAEAARLMTIGAFDVVHNANMMKVRIDRADVATSKRGCAFDLVKPDDWEAPNLSAFTKPRLRFSEEAQQLQLPGIGIINIPETGENR